ncbi:hypothetical protein RIF29_29936 [Crotalaria pallida]|uniref:Uncharacterized protein n=1 Tax=Crotalaria pallida TaxID=3830 RepID=A0AAN9EKL3_CROPI
MQKHYFKSKLYLILYIKAADYSLLRSIFCIWFVGFASRDPLTPVMLSIAISGSWPRQSNDNNITKF